MTSIYNIVKYGTVLFGMQNQEHQKLPVSIKIEGKILIEKVDSIIAQFKKQDGSEEFEQEDKFLVELEKDFNIRIDEENKKSETMRAQQQVFCNPFEKQIQQNRNAFSSCEKVKGEGAKCVVYQLLNSNGHVHSLEFNDNAIGFSKTSCEDKFKIQFLEQVKVKTGYGDALYTQEDEERYLFDHNEGKTGQESKELYMQTDKRYKEQYEYLLLIKKDEKWAGIGKDTEHVKKTVDTFIKLYVDLKALEIKPYDKSDFDIFKSKISEAWPSTLTWKDVKFQTTLDAHDILDLSNLDRIENINKNHVMTTYYEPLFQYLYQSQSVNNIKEYGSLQVNSQYAGKNQLNGVQRYFLQLGNQGCKNSSSDKCKKAIQDFKDLDDERLRKKEEARVFRQKMLDDKKKFLGNKQMTGKFIKAKEEVQATNEDADQVNTNEANANEANVDQEKAKQTNDSNVPNQGDISE